MLYKSTLPDLDIPLVNSATLVLSSPRFVDSLDKPLMTNPVTGEYMTYRDMRTDTHNLAAGLRTVVGLNKWDVVAVFGNNTTDYLLHHLARQRRLHPEELAFQLTDAGASILIVDPDLAATGKAAAQLAGLDLGRVFVTGDNDVDGLRALVDIFSDDPIEPVTFTEEELTTKPAYLTYSSGTTGRSKGVVTTHRNIVANILQFSHILDAANPPGTCWSGALPFSHMYGLTVMVHCIPYMGLRGVAIPKFDFKMLLFVIGKYKPAALFLIPPVMIGLAKHPSVASVDMSCIKCIVSGAAPLSADISRSLSERLVNAVIMQGYGLTETSPVAALSIPAKPVYGSAGVLVSNMEARLINTETGLDAAKGERGELWLRGPNVMFGYLNLPETTAEALTADGFLRTGDIATIDDDGNIFIVDRLKELVKYNGLQVPPAEVEAKLLTHSKIADAAVIGTPDDVSGELPLAYVVLQPGAELTEKEIQDYIAERVADHKQLRGGVIFTDAIPKSPSGKILRRVLREKDAARRAALAAGSAA
ncbi:hypothetical protein HK105_208240 [Polyrhizophydium stewartii]|uniref:Uncharacterized protein n=1 Tax=Polyrhizophydium stewartii TaxID=2732419 RepID=A0ABR4MYC7_9FUNG|nr:putative fatty-acid--CoA ligase FadD10 [Polyrhizophydium stewartii]